MSESMDVSIGSTDPLRGQITSDGKGGVVAPKEIISSIHAARAFYYKCRQESIKRINLAASIEGMIAGNPPYNAAELKKMGLNHIANFNTMEPRSFYERTALCFWNLINEAESAISFRLVYPGVRPDDAQLVKYADIMSRNWTEIVRDSWDSYIVNICTLSAQLVKFGVSPVVFHDERDWRWRTVEYSKLFIPDQTQADIGLMTCAAVESNFTVQYLYEVYEEFKDKKKSPWDTKELANLLLHIANSYIKSSYSDTIDMMELQKRYQNGDVNLDSMFSDSVRIISLFYKEYTGEVSHVMFHRVYDSGGFLFHAPKQYKLGMSEVLNIFTSSPGEFTIHSNRGLGHKIFSLMQAIMQLDCSIVDMSKWSSTPMLKTNNTGGHELMSIRFTPGVPTDIGTSEFQQNNIGANISQLVGASQFLSQKAQYNIANSGDDPGVPDRDQGSISAVQAKMRAYKEFNVLKHIVAHFYSQLDPVFRNMVAKMLGSKEGYPGFEIAREWKERCKDEGVPKEVFDYKPPTGFLLPRHIRVKATRVAGDGSTMARIIGLNELAPYLGQLGQEQVHEYMRQLVTATLGPDQAKVFVPDAQQPDEASGGASLAGVENVAMRLGESPVFSEDNEQKAHFVTHIALGTDTIRRAEQQQLDARGADKIFSVLIPHLGEHFAQLQRSPFTNGFAEQQKKNLNQITQYAQLNRRNAEAQIKADIKKQEEQSQQQQQAMSDAQRKDYVAQKDEQRKDLKVRSQVERAKEANVTRGDVMRTKVEKDAETKRLQVQLQHEAKLMETNNKIAIDSKKSLVDNQTELNTMMGKTPSPADFEPPE